MSDIYKEGSFIEKVLDSSVEGIGLDNYNDGDEA